MGSSAFTNRLGCAALLLVAGCGQEDGPAGGNEAAPAAPAAAANSLAPEQMEAGSDEAQLLELEQDYARALIAKDREFLMRFYAPDWRGGNWMGFWTKSTMLRSVLNETYVVKSMELRDVKVRVVGDIGVVQGVDEEVTSVRGSDTSGRWAFTDVFARRDGRWVAVASHTSEIKPDQP